MRHAPSIPNHLLWLSHAAVVALLVSACAGGGTQGDGGAPGASQDPAGAIERACPEAAAGSGGRETEESAAPTGAAAASASQQPAASAAAGGEGRDPACVDGSEDDAVSYDEHSGTDGRNNIIKAINRKDDNLLVRGSVQLNQITGDTVRPSNEAWAVGYRCTGCQTFAVALQINLIGRNANDVQPQNFAVAANLECTSCITVARALQYTYTVEDPTETPREVEELIRQMEHTLRKIDNQRGISLRDAEAQVNAVIAQFRELAETLDDKRDEESNGDFPSVSPVASGAPAATQGSGSAPTDGAGGTPIPQEPDATSAQPTAAPTAEATASPMP